MKLGYCLICSWSLWMWIGRIGGRDKWMCLGCKLQRWISSAR